MASCGILSYGVHLPYRRLDRSEIRPVAGTGGGTGTRTVASYDEDTTTMGVEASRLALRTAPDGVAPRSLWFATVDPAYTDKTNATAIHAALRLDAAAPAFDANGSVRSAVGALRAALRSGAPALAVSADIRTGLPGSPDEAAGGDAGAALLVGPAPGDGGGGGPLLAELIGEASATEEFLDRWRTPGEPRSKLWEERFGEGRYLALGQRAWEGALKAAGLVADEVDRVLVAGSQARAVSGLARKLDLGDRLDPVAKEVDGAVGFTGAAHPALLLAAALDRAAPGQVLALVVLADGADVLLFRTTDALAAYRPARPVADQIAGGGPVPYGKALAWRGFLPVEPPRRPEPARPSASAAARSTDWKFAFVGSESDDGAVHLPPAPTDDRVRPMAEATGTIVTFTIDRLAYSPSPPVVFAVVDFDGGGRLPVELTDVDADEVRIGGRVEMTFRRLFTADGIHNYFWKARPVREAPGKGS
ncbi:MAG TPA: OB-fold domain-containing protein [Acidimicrobiales bacterium]